MNKQRPKQTYIRIEVVMVCPNKVGTGPVVSVVEGLTYWVELVSNIFAKSWKYIEPRPVTGSQPFVARNPALQQTAAFLDEVEAQQLFAPD